MSTLSTSHNISETEFPHTGTPTEKLKFLLNYVSLTPAGQNTQAWSFKLNNKAIELYAERTRALPIFNLPERQLIISCGRALFNLRVALRHYGYQGKIVTLPDPSNTDLFARIHLGKFKQVSPDEQMLFEAIPKRQDNRQDYAEWTIPKSMLSWLEADAAIEGAWLHAVKGDTARNAVAELAIQGDRIQMADSNFRRELAESIHASSSQNYEGINEYVDFATPISTMVMPSCDLGASIPEYSRQLITKSPAIIVIGTQNDTPRDWLVAGQALQRVILRGQAVGLAASFLNQPIEVPALRSWLGNLLHQTGFPQILLCLGFSPEINQQCSQNLL